MMTVDVMFYAQLKDFFGENAVVEVPDSATPAEICAALTQKNVLAADWLKVSRLASDDAFLAEDYQLVNGGKYYLLPPSSGG